MNIIGIALDELYRIFDILNEKYYNNELPEPAITIQKARPNNLGHFTLDKVWKKAGSEDDSLSRYEININPVNLNRTVEQIICTLHHEMVHYANKLHDINDCNGQVHNKKFKALAEEVGLICEKSKKYGWGFTKCSDEFVTFIYDIIKPNDKVFEYFRADTVEEKPTKTKEKKNFKYTCPTCGLVVKAPKDKHIRCEECDMELEIEQ